MVVGLNAMSAMDLLYSCASYDETLRRQRMKARNENCTHLTNPQAM